jgi:hypothetical protein
VDSHLIVNGRQLARRIVAADGDRGVVTTRSGWPGIGGVADLLVQRVHGERAGTSAHAEHELSTPRRATRRSTSA